MSAVAEEPELASCTELRLWCRVPASLACLWAAGWTLSTWRWLAMEPSLLFKQVSAFDRADADRNGVISRVEFDTMAMLTKLEVCGTCHRLSRLGGRRDGGYLMCMDHILDGHIQGAFSMGVSDDDEWSEHVSRLLKVRVYQFDCTIQRPPPGCSNCTFFHRCIKDLRPEAQDRSWSLEKAIEAGGMAGAPSRSLVLKMDVEGSEWVAFLAQESRVLLAKFQQILLELHMLDQWENLQWYLQSLDILLNAGFRVVHIHGNNYGPVHRFGSYAAPVVLEVTLEAGAPPRECLTGIDAHPLDERNYMLRPELWARLPAESAFPRGRSFNAVDVNKDGTISRQEFYAASGVGSARGRAGVARR